MINKINKIVIAVRRSARLAECFRSDRDTNMEAVGASAIGLRGRPSAHFMVVHDYSNAPHRVVPGCVRNEMQNGAQLQGRSLRVVSVVLERVDIERYKSKRAREIELEIERNRYADPKPHTPIEVKFKNRNRNRYSSLLLTKTRNSSSVRSNSLLMTTGIRILQLNMKYSIAVMREVRQLVAKKRLDVLLLQEPYVRKRGQSYTICGLGTGVKVAIVRSQYPWAAVAIGNSQLQMLFVSQFSTIHCVCTEVQAPDFSTSYRATFSTKTRSSYISDIEKVFHTLRGKTLLVAVDANARSSLWDPQETDERGAKFEDLIRAFGTKVLNVARQSPLTGQQARHIST